MLQWCLHTRSNANAIAPVSAHTGYLKDKTVVRKKEPRVKNGESSPADLLFDVDFVTKNVHYRLIQTVSKRQECFLAC